MKLFDISERVLSYKEVKEFVTLYHYTHKLGHTMLPLGYFYNEILIGVVIYGFTTSSEHTKHWIQKIDATLTHRNYFELTRLCIHPNYRMKNLASFILGKSFSFLRKNRPEIKLLVSFADTNQNNPKGVPHLGYVYQATNWTFVGLGGDSVKMLVDGSPKGTTRRKDLHIANKKETVKFVKVKLKQKYLYFLCNRKIKEKYLSKIKHLEYPKLDKPATVHTRNIFAGECQDATRSFQAQGWCNSILPLQLSRTKMSNGRSKTVGQFKAKMVKWLAMADDIMLFARRLDPSGGLALRVTKFIEYGEHVIKEFNELLEDAKKKK